MSFDHYEPCPKCRERGRDGRGDNRAVYTDGSYHCFSCGDHKGTRFVVPKELQKVDHRGSKVLPADFSREIPAAAWKWLLQYGLSYRYWLPYVGYSEQDSRLVFTVGEPTEFSIGRYIEQPGVAVAEGSKPRKWFFYGDGHRTAHVFGEALDVQRSGATRKRVVLVEDLISAHKVAKLQPCIPLFGTNIFEAVVPVLRHLKLPVTIWLDADQQGNIVKKAANLALLTGLPVNYKFTDKDPKELTFEQIAGVLK